MGHRARLPLRFGTGRDETPSIDAIRTKLGGRAASEPGIGEIVTFVAPDGVSIVGAVVSVDGELLHVLQRTGRLHRVEAALAIRALADADAPLAELAADACVFAHLGEGERVRYHDDHGGVREACLVEKCRYGAILERDDGSLIAAGFRKMFPISRGEA